MTINFGFDKPIVHTRDPNDPTDAVLDELGAFDLLSANECDELWWGLRGLSLRELEILKKLAKAKTGKLLNPRE